MLTSREPSGATAQLLHRLGLADRFDENPAGTLAEIRGDGGGLSPDRLFALAELSFLYAEQENRQDYYLASAVYAYAFLFRKDGAIDEPLDPRTRLAADLYNFGLALALAAPPLATNDDTTSTRPAGTGTGVEVIEILVADRTLALPFGRLELHGDASEFEWGGMRLSRFILVSEFKIRGLRNRYRQPGIGVALGAEISQDGSGPQAEIARTYIPKRIKVPVTGFVRFENVTQGIADGRLHGRLELYPADEASTPRRRGPAAAARARARARSSPTRSKGRQSGTRSSASSCRREAARLHCASP